MKSPCFKEILHNLHGHSGFHVLIFSLNSSEDILFFIVSGTIDQILGARYDFVSVPSLTELALLLQNVLQFLSS